MVLKLEDPISFDAYGETEVLVVSGHDLYLCWKKGEDAGHEATISRQSRNLYKLFKNKEMNSENLQAIFLKQHNLTPINYQCQL